MRTRRHLCCVLMVLGVFVLACGSSGGQASPTSPTSAQAVTPPAAGGTAGAGTTPSSGTGTPGDASGTTPAPGQTPPTAPAGMTVAMGAVAGLTGTCPALTLTIDGKPVVTDARTRFEGGTCDALKTAPRAAAGGAKQADGSILAQVVRVGVMTPPAPPAGQARVQGLITDLGGSCATALTLKIDGKAVKIDAQTKFEQGSCGDVANGLRGGAIGKLVDGIIVAERAIVSRQPPVPGPTPGPAMTIIRGVVANISGSCPALKFTVDGKPVQMGPNPRFEGGGCLDVKAGIAVAAGGHLQPDGVLLAIGVKFGG